MKLSVAALVIAVLTTGVSSALRARNHARTGCAVALDGQYTGSFDYVCDTTIPWMHFDGSNWAPATPPEGTGCHEYSFYTGGKPACTAGSGCEACAAPSGDKHFSVRLMGGSCTPC